MAIEKDAASDGKKTLLLIITLVLVIGAGFFITWGWLHQADVGESQYRNLSTVANNAPVNKEETPEYRQLLHLSNEQGAEQAEREGASFVASLSESHLINNTPEKTPVVNTAPPVPVEHAQEADNSDELDDQQKASVNNFLKELSARWKISDSDLASIYAEKDQGENNPFSRWRDSLPGLVTPIQPQLTATSAAVQPGRSTTAETEPESQLNLSIPVLSRFPGVIETAIDSDNAGSIVLAAIPAGSMAGSLLSARGVQLSGEGITVHFTDMQYKGFNCKIDAYALDDENLRSSVASTVNHRYFSRIVLPALANGIGKIGQLYEDANTQILSTNSGTITGRTGTPDGKAVAGVVAGGIGERTAQVITQDASRLPITQIHVNRHQPVSILFMQPVSAHNCTMAPKRD